MTYRCVYLLDSACKRIFIFITQLVRYNSSICCTFFTYNVFKIAFVLFCFVSESVHYKSCLRARPVNSDYVLNVLETVKFVFCFEIHALVECAMNSKFCILHSALAASCSIQNFSFIVHSARACICKQNTNLTVSNPYKYRIVWDHIVTPDHIVTVISPLLGLERIIFRSSKQTCPSTTQKN